MQQQLSRLFRRVQHMLRPARTTAPARENDRVQHLQVQFNEFEIRELPSLQFYGLASSPLPDCDVLVAAIAGDGANSVVVNSGDQRFRPRNMTPGAVRLYNQAGTFIHIEGGTVTIVAGSKLIITSPEVTMSGKLTVAGDVTSTGGDVKAGTVSLKQHVHGGVQPGSGNTQAPVA